MVGAEWARFPDSGSRVTPWPYLARGTSVGELLTVSAVKYKTAGPRGGGPPTCRSTDRADARPFTRPRGPPETHPLRCTPLPRSAATAGNGATPSVSNTGTSSTGPPVPVSADPNPTKAPTATRRAVPSPSRVSRTARGRSCCTPTNSVRAASPSSTTDAGSVALTSAPRNAAGTTPTVNRASMPHGTTPRHAYATVPTTPVNRKAHVLVAVASLAVRSPRATSPGGSSTPPTPTMPTRTPTTTASTGRTSPTARSPSAGDGPSQASAAGPGIAQKGSGWFVSTIRCRTRPRRSTWS